MKYHYLKNNSGFNLMELLVVLIIVGILAALALPNFQKTREAAFDKEAKANLKLIQAAERIYYIENAFYMPASGFNSSSSTINTYLKLTLPTGTDSSNVWNYTTLSTGTGRATRLGIDQRTWTLAKDNATANCTCPGAECYCP